MYSVKAMCNLYAELNMNKIDIISSLHEYFAWFGFGAMSEIGNRLFRKGLSVIKVRVNK